MGKKTISISNEVHKKLVELKNKLGVNSIDLVLRWLMKMPPFTQEIYEYSIPNIKSEQENKAFAKASEYKDDIKSTQKAQEDNTSLIYRAKKYRDKIIKNQGFITEGQLEKVAKKFGLTIHDLMDDLIMKEPGKYYPLKG